MANTPLIWVLADDKPGHYNQALGVAEALDLPFAVKKLAFNAQAEKPNWLLGATLKGLVNPEIIAPPWPDIVIAAGRRTVPVARYIKKQHKGAFLCQLMRPGFPSGDFDLIAIPEHDVMSSARPFDLGLLRLPLKMFTNIFSFPKKIVNIFSGNPKNTRITTIGAPHRLTQEIIRREGEMWEKTLAKYPSPRIALMIGGSTKNTHFSTSHARELGKAASDLAKALGASLLITTSRRTSPEAQEALRRSLSCHYYWHNVEKAANPYIAFLALSDVILVTGDSISMCCEACATGKPVYIYAPEDLVPQKHRLLHQALFAQNFADPFIPANIVAIENHLQLLEKDAMGTIYTDAKPLSAAQDVADAIKERAG